MRVADSLADSSLQQLRAEQARLERDYAEKLGLFKPEWPAMVQLNAQIERNRQQIASLVSQSVSKARAAAEADYQAAQRREESLKAELRSQKSAMINLNSNELQYSERRLEQQSKQALLDSLLKRKAEADVVTRLGGERASYARIVERALPPPSSFRPSYRNNGLLGSVRGSRTRDWSGVFRFASGPKPANRGAGGGGARASGTRSDPVAWQQRRMDLSLRIGFPVRAARRKRRETRMPRKRSSCCRTAIRGTRLPNATAPSGRLSCCRGLAGSDPSS